MRVLHVIHSIDPRSGGPSHAIRALVREQAAAGHEVTLLTTTTQSAEPWAEREEYIRQMSADPDFENVELSIQPAFGRRRPWSRFAYSPAARRFLWRSLQGESRPDIVHIHGLFSHITRVAAVLSRQFRVPYVIRPAGGLDPWCLSHGRRGLKQLMLSAGVRGDLAKASSVQAMSRAEEVSLQKSFGLLNVVCVPHGTTRPPHQSGERDVLDQQIPEIRGRPFILFIGRIHTKKRPHLMVNAAARLRNEFPELMIVLAGHDDGGLSAVREAIERNGMHDAVVAPGFLAGEVKQAVLSAAQVFVLPSRDENFGVAVVEAMAHGTPILVTPGVASHEYVDASGCGLTVDGTPEALADGLRSLLRQDRDELGQRGRRYVEEHLTWPAVVAQLDEVYRSAIEQQQQACSQPLPIS